MGRNEKRIVAGRITPYGCCRSTPAKQYLGALSLDHVYEFMGGMNLAVRNVTGKDPEAYFADYRNRNRVRMQDLKEAIGVESRSTIFNPEYIKEVMKRRGVECFTDYRSGNEHLRVECHQA